MKRTLFFIGLFLITLVSMGYAQEWNEYKRKHFIVYYKEAPKDFVETVEETAEEYYTEISKNLGFTRYAGWTWDDRAKIYIYDDAEDYKKSDHGPQWSGGVVRVRDRVIRTFPTAHGFFDTTLPHELGHIIFREFVGERAQVPIWFEEGVAMNQEKARRWGAHAQVREAMSQGTFIPLDELHLWRLNNQTEQKLVELFYAESASIVQFMINELGEARFVRFCRELQKGRPFKWTLDSIYVRFDNLEDLNKAWVRYLKNE